MSSTVAFVLLLLAFIAWVSLPFIPAIMELVRPRDASPLAGVGNDSGELTWFAEGFRRYGDQTGLFRELDNRYGAVATAGVVPTRTDPEPFFQLKDQTTVRVLRSVNAAKDIMLLPGIPRAGDRAPEGVRDVVVIDVASQLPDNLAVDREVYARSSFVGGKGMRMRALLAASNANLAAGTTIVRWAHADDVLTVEGESSLFGRATAGKELRIASNVHFERIMAPRIVVGSEGDEFVPPPVGDSLHSEPWARPMTDRITQMSPDTLRVRGDLIVPEGAVVTNNLVVLGALVLERGCQLHGSAKANEGIQLAGENIITGSLTARKDLHVGERCLITGPIIGEGEIRIGAHSIVGTPQSLTTVTAPEITLCRGATIYGVVSARVAGRTV